MKKVSPTLIVPIIAMAVVGAGVYGVSEAVADSTGAKTSLAQEIADTFHLDKTKVQTVVDKHKDEMQVVREARYEARLTQAVTDGKLTSAQKEAVLAEHNKLRSELDAATAANRRTVMTGVRDEASAWAKQNNVDAKWLLLGGPGRMRGMGMRAHTSP